MQPQTNCISGDKSGNTVWDNQLLYGGDFNCRDIGVDETSTLILKQ